VPILKREPDLFPSDLFERHELTGSSGSDRRRGHWWVAYSRSRQEKGLARHLGEHGVPYYLPQAEKVVRRNGRRLQSFLPLFPGYVFLRGDGAERRMALRSNLVARVLEVWDQDRLREELTNLWTLQQSGAPLVPHPYVRAGDEVEIVDGPFRGWVGRVLREKGRLRLVVSISFLRQSVAAEIDRDLVAPARAPRPLRSQRPAPSLRRAAAAS
jgi:transcriptional antiterminator RfaH